MKIFFLLVLFETFEYTVYELTVLQTSDKLLYMYLKMNPF